MAKLITYKKSDLLVSNGHLVDSDNNIVVCPSSFDIIHEWEQYKEMCNKADYIAMQDDYAPWPSLDGYEGYPDVDFDIPNVPLDAEYEAILEADQPMFSVDQKQDAAWAKLKNEKVNKLISENFKHLAKFVVNDEFSVTSDAQSYANIWTAGPLLLSWGEFTQTLEYCVDQFARLKDGDTWLLGKENMCHCEETEVVEW